MPPAPALLRPLRPLALGAAVAAALSACNAGSSSHPGDGGGGTPPPPAASPAKRGVAYGFRSLADLHALSPGMSWWYNWSYRPDPPVAGDAGAEFVPPEFVPPEFVPMVWGGSFDDAAVKAGIPAGAKYLLAFNEPNFKKGQANLSAAQAAALWPRLEAIADARGLELVSPAVNFCGPPADCWDTDPISYLDDFFAACQGCRVDFVAAHWYACDGPALTWYLGQLKKYGKPIWLTEFSCGDGADVSLAAQEAYMKAAVPILEADPAVFRYAWFIGRSGKASWPVDLLGADGHLTELGSLYVGLPGE